MTFPPSVGNCSADGIQHVTPGRASHETTLLHRAPEHETVRLLHQMEGTGQAGRRARLTCRCVCVCAYSPSSVRSRGPAGASTHWSLLLRDGLSLVAVVAGMVRDPRVCVMRGPRVRVRVCVCVARLTARGPAAAAAAPLVFVMYVGHRGYDDQARFACGARQGRPMAP